MWLTTVSRTRRLLSNFATNIATSNQDNTDSIDSVVWAIETASRVIPATSCLEKGLAAEFLLIRFDIQPTVRIGVKRTSDSTINAHCWVEHNGETILGGNHATDTYETLPPLPRREQE